MSNYKNDYLIIALILLFVQSISFSQQDKFLFGTYIHSSDTDSTLYNNYEQILECGFNSVFQLAVKDVARLNQPSNFNQLLNFPFIYASNDSGTGTVFNALNAEPENIDWISYFTQAKYTKWEAEGNSIFNNPNAISIKHDVGSLYFAKPYTEGNISGIKSGNIQSDTGKFLIKGPNYWQYPRYTFTNVSGNKDTIFYSAVFRMRIGATSPTPLKVCEIMVTSTDKNGNETLLGLDDPKSYILTTANFPGTNYKDFIITYKYPAFKNANNSEVENLLPLPGMGIEENDGYGYNIDSRVQFKVKWLGNRELFVDFIEVYDNKIWKSWYLERFDDLVDSVKFYDQGFSTIITNLKFYGTQDEPHSIDCFEPLRKIQEILDDPINKLHAGLLTHYYPEWDGKRHDGNGLDYCFPSYVQLAQPKKLMFWYAPFGVDTAGVSRPRDFTLYFLKNNLQFAFQEQHDFYITLQTWGTKDENGNYKKYEYPTNAELSAETMLSLAHGVRYIL